MKCTLYLIIILLGDGSSAELTANSFGFTWDGDNAGYFYRLEKLPCYVGYDFKQDLICYKFMHIGISTTNPSGYGSTVKKYKLQGSNNGNNWEDIYNGENNKGKVNGFTVKEYTNSIKTYKKFRFYIEEMHTANNSNIICYNELQFYCIEKP